MTTRRIFIAVSLLAALNAQQPPATDALEVRIPSTKDGSPQPALFYVPPASGAPAPLLVFLHSWSTDYKTAGGWSDVLAESRRRGWPAIVPNFRGVNDHPEACGSDLAVQDVLDAVAYARQHASVDPKRIYLLGSSGGGYMSLLVATRAPKTWAAVSVWVPITNLSAWHNFSKSKNSQYYKMMDACFGGPPGAPDRDREYRRRSPLFFLPKAKGLRIYIDDGVNDGHGTNAVPVRHSLEAFNALAKANRQPRKALPEADVKAITSQAKIPPHLSAETQSDPARKEKILFRRAAGPVTLTIFDGGHSFDALTAIRYFE